MPDFSREEDFKGHVFGLDEAGRGPLAGPVVAACVHVPASARGKSFWRQVNDSKRVSAPLRADLESCIKENCLWSVAVADVSEIAALNILQASFAAMARALDSVRLLAHDHYGGHAPALQALVDGKHLPRGGFSCPAVALIGGDGKSCSIAAASILAKVARDRIMTQLHADFPHYGWDRNAGYGTPEHLAALSAHGPCPHHRENFAPVRAAATAIPRQKIAS